MANSVSFDISNVSAFIRGENQVSSSKIQAAAEWNVAENRDPEAPSDISKATFLAQMSV